MEANTGSLTNILHQLLGIFSLGQQGVAGSAFSLLTLLAGIELTLAALWWAITGRDGLVPLMRKILLLGFFVFVVQNYPTLLSIVVEGFIQTGKTASANGGDALASVRDPSTIIDAGFFVALPILDHLKSFGDWDVLFHLHDIIITGLCALGILGAYFIIAIQVFVTYLEFAIVSTLGLVLIPFGVFKHTAFLAEKVFGAIISFGVKLMVLGFLVSVTVPIIKAFNLPPDPSWTQLFNLVVVCFAVAALSWHAPGVAAGLLSGGPSLTAGTAAGATVAGAAIGVGSTLGASAATRAPAQIASSTYRGITSTTTAAAQALGIASGGAQVASYNKQIAGGGRLAQVSAGAGGAITSLAQSSFNKVTSPIRESFSGISSGFRSKQSSVPGFDSLAMRKASATGTQQSGSRSERNPSGAFTPQASSTTSPSQIPDKNPASPQDKKIDSTPREPVQHQKTESRNPRSHTRTAAHLHLAKEAFPETAQPQGGLHVPLPTNEEPKE